MPTILVTGGSGFIGRHFCWEAERLGWSLIVLSRSVEKAREVLPGSAEIISRLDEISSDINIDTIVNLAGEPLADKRWNESRKKQFFVSRSSFTDQLYDFFRRRAEAPIRLISGSAIGYYGPGSAPVDESNSAVDGFSHKLCASWEDSALQFKNLGTRVCLVRTGIVLGEQGALAKMLPPFRMGLGGPIGNGEQVMSWIHIRDMVRVLNHCIQSEKLSGPINATAPNSSINREFTATLAKVLGRPALLPMPSFMVRLLFGEMGEELLLQGQEVIPAKLLQSKFEFEYPNLTEALQDLLK